MHDPDQELEQFLDQLTSALASYQTARINLILLSQRRDPTPTVRTWAGTIDKLRAEQSKVQHLILDYVRVTEPAEVTEPADARAGAGASSIEFAPES